MSVRQGSVVWVTVSDQADRNPKCRPAIVVTPTEEINDDEPIVIVAATSTFASPLPENQIELPWKSGGHPVTGLYKRCVAVCDWLTEITLDRVQDVGGQIPEHILRQILDNLPKDE